MCYCLIRKPCYRRDNRAMPLYISIRIKIYNDSVASWVVDLDLDLDLAIGGLVTSLLLVKKRERGRIQGAVQIFGLSPTISGTGKATNFKFGRYIHRVHPNKSPLKILEFWGKRSVGVSRNCPNFCSTPYYPRNG